MCIDQDAVEKFGLCKREPRGATIVPTVGTLFLEIRPFWLRSHFYLWPSDWPIPALFRFPLSSYLSESPLLILGLEITNFKDVEGEQKMAGTWTTGLLAIFMLISIVKADLIFTYEGVEERVPLTQLWYEGRWKEVRKACPKVFGPRLRSGHLFWFLSRSKEQRMPYLEEKLMGLHVIDSWKRLRRP